MKRPTLAILLVSLLALIGTAIGPVAAQTSEEPAGDQVAIPDDAFRVCGTCDTSSLADAIESAPEGSTIAVEGGTHDGPIEITKTLTLIGVDDPVIDGLNEGTTITITAPDVTIQGFSIRNSGSNFDKEDSAIYIDDAINPRIIDNEIVNALFGVNVAQSENPLVARNTIVGKDVEMGLRGDGIKVWYSHGAQIVENRIVASRDVLMMYSNDVVVRDNQVSDGRYGFHFMNCDNGLVERNTLTGNSVGIYLMYGKKFVIHGNLLEGSHGPSGYGLGLKEIDGVDVEGNIVYDNRIGVYIDNSPLSPDVYDHFERNLIAYNDSGLGMQPSARNNVFTQNSMIDNLEQVTVLGGGPLGENQWSVGGVGNFWSDYVGYDADGDGIGDVPFKSMELSEQLMSSWPILQLFRFSVAESAVDFGARAVPMFQKEPTFIDDSPLVEPVVPANAATPARDDDTVSARLWSIALLALAGSAVWWGRLNGRRTDRLLLGPPASRWRTFNTSPGAGGTRPQGKAS